jgi:hypothetical protein
MLPRCLRQHACRAAGFAPGKIEKFASIKYSTVSSMTNL